MHTNPANGGSLLRPAADPFSQRRPYLQVFDNVSTATSSVSSEDPLVRRREPMPNDAAATLRPSQAVVSPSATKPEPPRARIAVVLSASPKKDGDAIKREKLEGRTTIVSLGGSSPMTVHEAAATLRPLGEAADGPPGTASTPAASAPSSPPKSRGRGRPRGWRPGMSYRSAGAGGRGGGASVLATAAASREARQIKTRPSLQGFPKRRGRPPKAPSPPPRAIYDRIDTPFVAFLCEWRGCRAELHNLETLRRHVRVVHGRGSATAARRSPTRRCVWGKCGGGGGADDDRAGVLLRGYDEFVAHAEEAHLRPLAWHVGDGPSNSLRGLAPHGEGKRTGDDGDGKGRNEPVDGDDGEDIPGYLKDAKGNQVTPSIRGQEVEDFMTWRNNRRKLRELLIRRDENLPTEDEDESEVRDEMQRDT